MSTPPPPFEYKATAGWYAGGPANVTSMTVDGQPYASGQFVMIDETFASYDDARSSFVPRNVVITTTSGTATFQIDLGACENVSPSSMVDTPLVMESDQFEIDPSPQDPAGVAFFVGCGSCTGKSRTVAFCG